MKLQEGIIAFLDALGTKGIWGRSDPEQYTERWDSFLKYWKGYRDTLQEQSRDELKTHYKMKIFSDTIEDQN